MKVLTTKGEIDRKSLQVKDIIKEEDNARITVTEWYLGNELVRRDVNVNVLRGLDILGESQEI